MRAVRLTSTALALLGTTIMALADNGNVLKLDSAVVSAPRANESIADITSTVQVIDSEQIQRSSARSLTDLLAENAVGFFSEWTPGQTSINIRGGSTDGQGRDFRSQVTVLVNGRRSGTANISKLSPAQVSRIEIIRGPASVIYGSQAIGGVINIITRDGQNVSGNGATLQTGSWGLGQGSVYSSGMFGAMDYYIGVDAGRRDDYRSKDGTQQNTAWKRRGGLLALGFDTDSDQRLELTLRSDGIYDAGFRGSQWDYDNYDNRYNQSIEASWTAAVGDWMNWAAQGYAFRDVDDLHWGSERLSSGAPGFSKDNIERKLTGYGLKLTPQLLLGPSTDLLLGLDLEKSKLRNDRFRVSVNGATTSQAAPYDINSDDLSAALYAELIQRLMDDRLTLRAGARYSYGRSATVATQYLPLLDESTRSFDETTYSLGAAFQAQPWLKLRAGVSTGFRAPLAGELAADFTTTSGNQTLGNANLKAETSLQFETGLTLTGSDHFFDLAVFQNRIRDRIVTRPLTSTVGQYSNGDGDAVIRGVEAQWQYDLASALALQGDQLLRLNASGVWNWNMKDEGASPNLTGTHRDEIQRMYRHQASLGMTYGKHDLWDLGLTAILRGPIYYRTEEKLLIPAGQPNANYVHRKDSFWVFNLGGNYQLTPDLALFSGVNNLFDIDRSSLFIANGNNSSIADPNASNGGLGNSNPGRELYLGANYRF
ncbi:TonB-dependent receptor [Stutzerimonas stutzeri]|uniref:TonB-dependent receptor n=1 Tax=Stutzerimonas stutzeri TaxID=316 RepID=A0A2S4ATN8_STUST|nr:TonB-dependent receptor [Stutzerimonas stutzeri]MCQ4261554.1 TonB-dependent receptor [Stutzerimonas stutzeri]POH84851.1 TonB-dependent receptor [Stutzerimonas stutzeri]